MQGFCTESMGILQSWYEMVQGTCRGSIGKIQSHMGTFGLPSLDCFLFYKQGASLPSFRHVVFCSYPGRPGYSGRKGLEGGLSNENNKGKGLQGLEFVGNGVDEPVQKT